MSIYVWVFFWWLYFLFHEACGAKILHPTTFVLKFLGKDLILMAACLLHNSVCVHRPARRCVLFHWAAVLSAGAHTGWWSGRSPQPEHSPGNQIQGETRLKNKQTNKRQWTDCSRRECRSLERAEQSEGNNRFGCVIENERTIVKQGWCDHSPTFSQHWSTADMYVWVCVCVCVYREWDWAKYRKCTKTFLSEHCYFFKQRTQQLLKDLKQ